MFTPRAHGQFLVADLLPKGREIIECCIAGGGVADYEALLGMATLNSDEA